jgi:mevalonate kinase
MIAASAPGKVILFGEHAVVSGKAALGSAIDLRARATVQRLQGCTEIRLPGLDLRIRGFLVDDTSKNASAIHDPTEAVHKARYVAAAIKEFEAKDIRITIESSIPPGSGLGSSAATTVAAVAALSKYAGVELSMQDIASTSHRIERAAQEGLGSPMDTALATFGGYQLISNKPCSIDLPQIRLVVGYSGKLHDTRLLVAGVQDLLKKYPAIVEPIFEAIGSISNEGARCIREGRFEELGCLMNMNNGLLEAIGVGTSDLSQMVYASRGAGRALGAKITGAGGGGCIIALPSAGAEEALATAIRQAGGYAFTVSTGCQGVRLERPEESGSSEVRKIK